MPPAIGLLTAHLLDAREPRRWAGRFAIPAALHMAALVLMVLTEVDVVARTAFLLGWILFNFLWLALLRRPGIAAALSLAMVVLIVLLSRFKHDVLLMTANFVDLMVVDRDTFFFLMNVFPHLGTKVWLAAAAALAVLVLVWRLDHLRFPRWKAGLGAGAALAALVVLSLLFPSDPWDEWNRENYVSKFVRSGVTAVGDLMTRGVLESEAAVVERLAVAPEPCTPTRRPPNIVMVFDESSFDIGAVPGIRLPAGYGTHFKSFDGKQRAFVVEGAGGPSWYTEYNVMTGLSARSYGRFAEFVTRIAAGRVERGLPQALRRCGYKTISLYPMYGAFLGAREFQRTAGIEHFYDSKALGAVFLEPDRFYFDKAAQMFAKERGDKPLFLFVYTAANHFPWTYRFRPDLAPEWRDLGNRADVDEYLRRQHLSAQDYTEFVARLSRDFPDEPFLIVRFGDHQPYFARNLIDPGMDDSLIARRIAAADPRFLTTYYAIDALNYRPAELADALDTLDAPYLPLVVLEAAGLPLDPSFAEQKKILQRCRGLFYRCADGAEARRFNRMLIDAGLIKGL
jgi:Sulfatase